MIEAQQRTLDQVPDRPMVPIAADSGLNQARWLIDRLLAAESAPATTQTRSPTESAT